MSADTTTDEIRVFDSYLVTEQQLLDQLRALSPDVTFNHPVFDASKYRLADALAFDPDAHLIRIYKAVRSFRYAVNPKTNRTFLMDMKKVAENLKIVHSALIYGGDYDNYEAQFIFVVPVGSITNAEIAAASLLRCAVLQIYIPDAFAPIKVAQNTLYLNELYDSQHILHERKTKARDAEKARLKNEHRPQEQLSAKERYAAYFKQPEKLQKYRTGQAKTDPEG